MTRPDTVRFDAFELAGRVRDADAIVVGSGVAGLTAALALAPRHVVVLSKSGFGSGGSSHWAQGGVAAALGADDSPKLHAADTFDAAAGLAETRPVRVLTEEGPEQVRRLIERGARFDRGADGTLSLGREGAHGRRRIVHADGDRTGAEIVRTLVAAVRAQPSIEIVEHAFATDLVLGTADRVDGVLAWVDANEVDANEVDADEVADPTRVLFRAPAVVLATGGFGRLYSRTTNPVENTGDGLAMAARAGAELADLEMVQFHPTALAAPHRLAPHSLAPHSLASSADPLPLVTEALRGEGSILVDQEGRRFMPAIDPRAELAPRDVVARAIWSLERDGGRAFLDARAAVGEAFPERFPTVWRHCRDHGIDPRREPIPVTPAAHYTMAGIVVDSFGRTSLDGLWACGEVTASGVHGANRLASNSLLEALVWGDRVARDVAARPERRPSDAGVVVREARRAPEDPAVLEAIRALAWDRLGLVRDRDGLEQALAILDALPSVASADAEPTDDAPGDVANLALIVRLVASAALTREESRGGHFRVDFPSEDPAWRRRLLWRFRADRPSRPLEPVVPALPAVAEVA